MKTEKIKEETELEKEIKIILKRKQSLRHLRSNNIPDVESKLNFMFYCEGDVLELIKEARKQTIEEVKKMIEKCEIFETRQDLEGEGVEYILIEKQDLLSKLDKVKE